jgi:hypothetical protein
MADRSGFQPFREATAFQAVEYSQNARLARIIAAALKFALPLPATAHRDMVGLGQQEDGA